MLDPRHTLEDEAGAEANRVGDDRGSPERWQHAGQEWGGGWQKAQVWPVVNMEGAGIKQWDLSQVWTPEERLQYAQWADEAGCQSYVTGTKQSPTQKSTSRS